MIEKLGARATGGAPAVHAALSQLGLLGATNPVPTGSAFTPLTHILRVSPLEGVAQVSQATRLLESTPSSNHWHINMLAGSQGKSGDFGTSSLADLQSPLTIVAALLPQYQPRLPFKVRMALVVCVQNHIAVF